MLCCEQFWKPLLAESLLLNALSGGSGPPTPSPRLSNDKPSRKQPSSLGTGQLVASGERWNSAQPLCHPCTPTRRWALCFWPDPTPPSTLTMMSVLSLFHHCPGLAALFRAPGRIFISSRPPSFLIPTQAFAASFVFGSLCVFKVLESDLALSRKLDPFAV